MSDIERRPSRLPRKTREERAYRLVVAGGTFAAVAVIGFVLAIAGVIGWGIPFIAVVIAVVCGLLFRRAVGR
jgi:predicted MFS family arabinose efflux permease